MFIDTSAIIAVLTGEPKSAEISAAIDNAKERYTTPLTRLETAVVLAKKLDMTPLSVEALFDEFLLEANVTVVPITDAIGRMAVAARDLYGKGRHTAQLNLADCMAYAAAKTYNMPLLFIGNDFSQTDIKSALSNPRPDS
jgi:ribonuclease VapC